jgi:hypothetical protein
MRHKELNQRNGLLEIDTKAVLREETSGSTQWKELKYIPFVHSI